MTKMDGYEMVFSPEASSKAALRGHNCQPDYSVDYDYEIKNPHGTIVCCDKCGQHWFAYIWKSGSLYTTRWYKVRWFHYKKRRRILGIE